MRCRRLITTSLLLASASRYSRQLRFASTTTGNSSASAPPPPSPPTSDPVVDAEKAEDATPANTTTNSEIPTAPDADASTESTQSSTPVRATAEKTQDDDLTVPEPEPLRWVQEAYQDPDKMPIVDEKGEYIVSKGNWPTGEVAYTTPAPVDDKLAPRFGYNVVSVRKHVSWWKYNQKYPSFSLAYVNIQVLFILGIAWLCAFVTEEYRRATEEMKTPGAMVGEHRGRGPETSKTQKIKFTQNEMGDLVNRAQENWMDGKAEASYIGSKEYQMRKIARPKEFSVDDFRKR